MGYIIERFNFIWKTKNLTTTTRRIAIPLMGIQRKSLTILLTTAVTIATTAIVHSKRKLTDRTKDAVTTTAETAMTTATAMITIAVIVMKIMVVIVMKIMVAIVMKITVAIVTTIVTMVITQKTKNHIILISKRMRDIVNLTTITVTKATIVTKVITAMKVISKTIILKNLSTRNNAPIDYPTVTPAEVRLNKYIADAGICSRRNADMYISSGNVTVNGEVMTTLGYRVKPTDEVRFDGKLLSSEKKEYILLNKPKGFITTTNDEKGRKTVMDLVANATNARILPVGRLDRATTGLLLLTNDGELTKKLTHPTHGVRKIYHVILDRKLDYKDFMKIQDGLELEDGFIEVDEISYVNDKPKNEIGIKIHSGRNRIVRRIFEHLGYQVEKLDRVVFAGLTKKDLPRGHWRRLTQQEVINLRNMK